MSDHTSKTPLEFRNSYETPFYLVNWLDSLFGFEVDLAASNENSVCDNYFTLEHDSLKQDWSQYKTGFLNPPYDNVTPWVTKSIEEQAKGFTTIMIIPCPNGESRYEDIFDHASELIFINGRISFLSACDWVMPGKNGKPDRHIKKGEPVTGNTRGTFVVVFGPIKRPPRLSHVNRDELKRKFE